MGGDGQHQVAVAVAAEKTGLIGCRFAPARRNAGATPPVRSGELRFRSRRRERGNFFMARGRPVDGPMRFRLIA